MKIILIIYVLAAISCCREYKCLHDEIVKNSPPIEAPSENQGDYLYTENLRSASFEPMRLHFDFSALSYFYNFKAYSLLKNKVIPFVKDFLEKRISTVRRRGFLFFPYFQRTCNQVRIPQQYRMSGIDTDIVIFVTAERNTEIPFLAWAAPCYLDTIYDGRPSAGQLNFNSYYIDDMPESFEKIVKKFANYPIGFSINLFHKWVDEHGARRPRRSIYEFVNVRGYKTMVLKTPKILEIAKKHYNCSKIYGVELENQGSPGSFGSHFERSLLFNELMTASSLRDTVISPFSFAALEDSGWYHVNFNLTEDFFWGKNKGCSFSFHSCEKSNKTFNYFCNKKRQAGCSWDGHTKGNCHQDRFGDSCMYFVGRSNLDCRVKKNANFTSAYYGEEFGFTSKCVNANLKKIGFIEPNRAQKDNQLRCMKYACDKNHTKITFFIGNNIVNCTRKGNNISVIGFIGNITCPNPKEFCRNYHEICPNSCSGKGYCFKGKCECDKYYTGLDCSKRVLPQFIEKPKQNYLIISS